MHLRHLCRIQSNKLYKKKKKKKKRKKSILKYDIRTNFYPLASTPPPPFSCLSFGQGLQEREEWQGRQGGMRGVATLSTHERIPSLTMTRMIINMH
jgi:hypothetical protein